jgi:PIN domain nuclease of toxin-antitoxin system
MRYLLDTHVVLWWLTEPDKIHTKAKKIIQDRSNEILISSASFWEIAIKKSIGRLTMPHNLLETTAIEGFKVLPIMPEECIGVADLPLLHADPFDRLLVMQAKLYDLVIITRDDKIAEYPTITVRA